MALYNLIMNMPLGLVALMMIWLLLFCALVIIKLRQAGNEAHRRTVLVEMGMFREWPK